MDGNLFLQKIREKGDATKQVQVHPKEKLMADAQKCNTNMLESKGKEGDKLQIFDDYDSDDEYDGLFDEVMERGETSSRQLMLVKCSTKLCHDTEEKWDGLQATVTEDDERMKDTNVDGDQEKAKGKQDIPASTTEAQLIKVTRFSDRVQEKITQEVQHKVDKKRDLEGLQKTEIQEVMKTGVKAMMQAAITVLHQQGKCVMVRTIQDSTEDEEQNES